MTSVEVAFFTIITLFPVSICVRVCVYVTMLFYCDHPTNEMHHSQFWNVSVYGVFVGGIFLFSPTELHTAVTGS